ncbi:MAG: SDR family oxidoreductase [Chloroflexi bacterium]|nr:SDR family oxidoreductase [Chloroflexota bacterium]
MRFQGKVALVTGAASGIGKGIALRLGQEGASVALCDMNGPGVRDAAREARQSGAKAAAYVCDVRKRAQVDRTIDRIVQRWGRLDILVNNAAIATNARLVEMPDDIWDLVLQTNLTGAFYCLRAAARVMVKQRYGRIINVTSTGAFRPRMFRGHYCATKAGLHMLTLVAAAELAPFGVTVNALAPGLTETGMTRHVLQQPEARTARLKEVPLGRLGLPEDHAAAVAYLASDEAAWVTGAAVLADGGILTADPTAMVRVTGKA